MNEYSFIETQISLPGSAFKSLFQAFGSWKEGYSNDAIGTAKRNLPPPPPPPPDSPLLLWKRIIPYVI